MVRLARAIPTPRCAHGVDFPETRCDPCISIADDERWIRSQGRQIDAVEFELDNMKRELARRARSLAAKRAARTRAKGTKERDRSQVAPRVPAVGDRG